MKKFFSGLINFLSIVMILFSVVVLLNVVMMKSGEIPNVAGYSMLRVLTGSMEPEIPTDSIIVVRRTDPEEVQVGDVISFYSSDPSLGGAVNTHRVLEIKEENGLLVYTTKGDANHITDNYPPNEKDLIGVVIFSSGLLGVFIRLLSNPVIFLPLVLLPLLILIIMNLVRAVRSTREIMRQEEEAAVREAIEAARRKRAENSGNPDCTE